jgi:hypothetical protein
MDMLMMAMRVGWSIPRPAQADPNLYARVGPVTMDMIGVVHMARRLMMREDMLLACMGRRPVGLAAVQMFAVVRSLPLGAIIVSEHRCCYT